MSGGEAAAGLVSLSNKGPASLLLEAEKHQRRVWRLQRGVIGAARVVQNDLLVQGVRFRTALVTLTYRPQVQWQPGHIRALARLYQKWCTRRGVTFRCVWTMELQGNGKPHYHLILWLPRGVTPPMPDKQGWWPHGMTNAKWARSPVGYIAKYASKGTQGAVPKGARMWGHSGLTVAQRARVQWCIAPRWLRRMTDPAQGVRRVTLRTPQVYEPPAGFWTNPATHPVFPDLVQRMWCCVRSGFRFESPFEFGGMDTNGLVLTRREMPRCWSPEGEQFFYGVTA